MTYRGVRGDTISCARSSGFMKSITGRRTAAKLILVIIAYHVFGFIVIQLAGYYLNGHLFNPVALARWDALHYQWIAEHGYVPFRQAFFPFLPLIWRILSVDVLGISVFNSVLYVSCLFALARLLSTPTKTLLIWMSLPSAIFFFAPYSESIFFVGATVIIVALRSHSRAWIAIGLLACVLSRPAFTTLLPSLLLVSFVSNLNRKAFAVESAIYITISVIGLFLVSLFQHQYTGDWFGFITAQQVWGNKLQIPSLPLSSWGSQAVSSLDAVAFLIGVLSFIYLCHILWVKLKSGSFIVRPEILLSCGCIASISLLTLLFRGGELFSLNRFVFATPFVLVLINHSINEMKALRSRYYPWIFLFLISYFMLFGAYVHIQTFLKFSALSVYLLVALHVMHNQDRGKSWLWGAWLITTFAIQMYFAFSFLNGGWVA